jgi:glycosyltransferase involved in cell wall biosynthesis
MSDVLVYDRPGTGHTARGVEVIARVLGAKQLIEPLDTAQPKLEAWPGLVMLCSANNYFGNFGYIAVRRMLAGRRTVAQFIRDPRIYNERLKWFGRRGEISLNRTRLYLDIILRLPLVSSISILPPAPGQPLGFKHWLYDPEWWDLHVAPLAEVDVALPARGRTIVYMGRVQQRKGTAFFLRAASEAARRNMDLQFVIVGDASELTETQKAAFAAAGGALIARVADDSAFVSFIRKADWAWCCYEPQWEASSGIFGRALQLGTKSIVRRGSYLAHFHDLHAKGIQVDYDDVDGLLEGLTRPDKWRDGSVDVAQLAAVSAGRLRSSCGLG